MEQVLRLEQSPLAYRILDQSDADQLYSIYPDLPKSYLYGCPTCGKNRGDMVDGITVVNGIEYVCNCQDQLQRHKHYLNAGIGLTYQILSWNDFHGDAEAYADVSRYMEEFHSNIESGRGLLLYGEQYGTGKSMLGYLILKECVFAGYRCYATTYLDMLSSLKAGWRDEQYAKWYRDKIDSAQILMIDDVGKELMQASGFNNDFSKQQLDGLMRTRTQQSRATIITTNLSTGDISRVYGSALWSLISENMTPIKVDGVDYRRSVDKPPKGQRRIY